MYTIKEVASKIGFKIGTLRYWIRKNAKDFASKYYDYNLMDLIEKENCGINKNNKREYFHEAIENLDEFKYEFFKYLNHINAEKDKKRNSKFSWTNSAIDCYSCQMECRYCTNQSICKNLIKENDLEPPMKNVVKKLLKEIGKPTNYYPQKNKETNGT